MLCLLLKDWHCFKINIVICHSQKFTVPSSTFRYFLCHPHIKEQKFRCERACETNKYLMNKKAYWIKNHCHFKWLYKTSCYKTKSNFSQFLYSNLLLYECFFSFLNTSVCKIWKVDKTSSSSFYYIWKWRKFENTDRNISWKLLIFCENYYYFDRLKPKVFFVDQPWWPA